MKTVPRMLCRAQSWLGVIVMLNGCAIPDNKVYHGPPPGEAPAATGKLTAAKATPVEEDGKASWSVKCSPVEIVTNEASVTTSEGECNGWGGHQSRLVRTSDGVFALWMKNTSDPKLAEWRVSRREENGAWKVMAHGPSGMQAANLVAAPDGTLHVLAWLGGELVHSFGKPSNGRLTMTLLKPELPSEGLWSYGAAAISPEGDVIALASEGGWDSKGRLCLARRTAADQRWRMLEMATEYRHCYAYLFPGEHGALTISATRDTTWESLGLQRPQGARNYAFSAFKVWHTSNLGSKLPAVINQDSEAATAAYPLADLNPQMDAYLDTSSRLHLLYTKQGASTGGRLERRHRILDAEGKIVNDSRLPDEAGEFNRLFQTRAGSFYLLSSQGFLIPMGKDGTQPGKAKKLDLGGHTVAYSGFSIAAPRGGTPRSNVIDVGFPCENDRQWLYMQLEITDAATAVVMVTAQP